MKVFQGKIFPYSNGYPQLVAWLHQVNDDQSPVFVTDWAYCDGFINPEVYGMRYYGSQTKSIRLLPLRYPYQQAILYPSQLTVDSRFFVVGYIGRDFIDQYLKSQARDYRTRRFGHLWLFEAEREGATARWLDSSLQSSHIIPRRSI